MDHRILRIVMILVPIVVSCETMASGMFNLTAGYEQTSGTYGLASETNIEQISLLAEYTTDAWLFSVYVPFVSVTGAATIIPNSGGMLSSNIFNVGPGAGGSVATRSGLGDITTRLSYAFPPKVGHYLFYELTGELKLATASTNKNLGTGENDYSLSLYAMYEKYDIRPFMSLGYITIGDTVFVDYKDVVFATGGFTYQINSKTSFGLTYDYQQASIDGVDDGAMVNMNLSHQWNRRWSTNIYFMNGLTDSVADSGVGLSLSRNF